VALVQIRRFSCVPAKRLDQKVMIWSMIDMAWYQQLSADSNPGCDDDHRQQGWETLVIVVGGIKTEYLGIGPDPARCERRTI